MSKIPKLTDEEARMCFDPERDNEKALDEHISPILDQLRDACRFYGLPFMCVIQYAENNLVTSGSVFSGAHGVFDEVAEAIGLEIEPIVNN